MKRLFSQAVILFVVCALASITASAATTSRRLTFSRVVTVNGTPVKAGTYKATFDDKTGEFTILTGKKVVARSTARPEAVEGADRGGFSTRNNGEISDLVSVNMNSTTRAVIINDSDGKASSAPLPIITPNRLLLLVPFTP